jgi:hypothetical protein
MTTVNKGGVTASGKGAKAAGPKLADPGALRAKLADEASQSRDVVFVGNADHLHLRPPRPIYDDHGRHIGEDSGVFIDFGGVGRTRAYNPDLADDADYIRKVREILEQKPVNNDVHRLGIRELKPEEPAPPFARWDEYSPEHIKVWLGAALGSDPDANSRLVKECARYEAANKNRDDVLGMLAGLLVSEGGVRDVFDTEIVLA